MFFLLGYRDLAGGRATYSGTEFSSHEETFEKRPLLANLGVRLKFQSSKYSIYSCG